MCLTRLATDLPMTARRSLRVTHYELAVLVVALAPSLPLLGPIPDWGVYLYILPKDSAL